MNGGLLALEAVDDDDEEEEASSGMADSCGACFSVRRGWSATDATSRLVRFLGAAALESIRAQVSGGLWSRASRSRSG